MDCLRREATETEAGLGFNPQVKRSVSGHNKIKKRGLSAAEIHVMRENYFGRLGMKTKARKSYFGIKLMREI